MKGENEVIAFKMLSSAYVLFLFNRIDIEIKLNTLT